MKPVFKNWGQVHKNEWITCILVESAYVKIYISPGTRRCYIEQRIIIIES
jgi:hypothetical protein